MKKSTYSNDLKDIRWIEKRNKVIRRDHHRCTECGNTEWLQAHHTTYSTKLKPWEYPDHTLITLCADCHERLHALQDGDREGFYRWATSTPKTKYWKQKVCNGAILPVVNNWLNSQDKDKTAEVEILRRLLKIQKEYQKKNGFPKEPPAQNEKPVQFAHH